MDLEYCAGRCQCGRLIKFSDTARDDILQCECGAKYRLPVRAGWLFRFIGALGWKWKARWMPSARLQRSATVPYREADVARISCPRCHIAPKADDRWWCAYCSCYWNTFETRGLCPGCSFRYPATVCPSCHLMSRHEDWYRDD